MASTSVRFVTRGSKLQSRITLYPSTRRAGLHSGRLPPQLLNRASASIYTCTPSWQGLSHRRQHCSTSVAPCTIYPTQQISTLCARWTTKPRAQIPKKSPVFPKNVVQSRFASGQPSLPNEKRETGPPPTKIDASQAIKSALSPPSHENIYTLPNLLTFSRLLSAPAIGYFILTSQPVLALALFAYAGITDLVDGAIARHYNSATVVGTILDPMADKTLMTVTVICLGLQGHIPIWLAVIILGRDVGLAISACYYRYISLPPPKTFTRYWDFSLPSAEVRPTEISKINTLLQLLLVGNAMLLPVLPVAWVEAWNLVGVFEGWQFLVAGTTVWSGLSYVFSNDAVKILSQKEAIEKEKENKA